MHAFIEKLKILHIWAAKSWGYIFHYVPVNDGFSASGYC